MFLPECCKWMKMTLLMHLFVCSNNHFLDSTIQTSTLIDIISTWILSKYIMHPAYTSTPTISNTTILGYTACFVWYTPARVAGTFFYLIIYLESPLHLIRKPGTSGKEAHRNRKKARIYTCANIERGQGLQVRTQLLTTEVRTQHLSLLEQRPKCPHFGRERAWAPSPPKKKK